MSICSEDSQMAGFDFEFETKKRYRDDAKQWIAHFQRLSKLYFLSSNYKLTSGANGRVRVYCIVDGTLPAIQQFDRSIVKESLRFAFAAGRQKTLQRHIIIPFLAKEEKGDIAQIDRDKEEKGDIAQIDMCPRS
jgi:DNA invertase Pin-like site-specific DNA recombinase